MCPQMVEGSRILLITGARQVGKSTALRAAVEDMRHAGVRVSGLLTERTGPHDLAVTELVTGATYPLTESFVATPGSPTPHFTMKAEALARSACALLNSFPTQLFVLDELGPLELKHRQGWVGAFELLAQETYQVAVIVVRPELLGNAISEMPGTSFTVFNVTTTNRDAVPALLDREIRARLGSIPGAGRGMPL